MMRQTRWATRLVALLFVGGGAQVLGCFPFDYSEEDGTGGSGGTGGYEPPACPGDPVADPALVRDDCGTFVSASAAPNGNGTMAAPFASLAEAAAQGAKRIYACAEDYDATETVEFAGGVEIYAGFTNCGPGGTWTWADASRATLRGPADKVALTLDGGDNLLRNLNVTAADAVTPGGSSIAVVASGGSLSVTGGDLTAGAAMDGEAGMSPPDDPTLDGEDGDPGVGVCMSAASNPGPAGKTKACAMGDPSVAGKGGDGGGLMGMMLLPAGSGTDGEPADPAEPMRGLGGIGEGEGNPPASSCVDGTTGADGAPGDSGEGALGGGTLSIDGYVGGEGAPGTSGKPGQGGGGGGGARGGTAVTCNAVTLPRVGSSGGAGGTGGCGGIAGIGGKAGGSSIALIVLDSTVSLTDVILTAGRAGNGGQGGNGQTGGFGGQGGVRGNGTGAAKPSCRGGDGGQGGAGGPGGGGQGGHSLGIAFQGGTAPEGGAFAIDPLNAGSGGLGGANSSAPNAGQGADGVAADCWDFATNTACGG